MNRKSNQFTALSELLEWTGSIDNIYNPKISGLENVSFLNLIYSQLKEVNPLDITISKSLDHTMYHSIDTYVKQKLPIDVFIRAVIQKKRIEIHGIYPEHLNTQSNIIENQNYLEEIDFKNNSNDKVFNFLRPKFFVDSERLCVFVTPGKDYLFHYSSLILYLLDSLTTRSVELVKIFRYPYAENSIHVWSSLNEDFISKDDIVVLGYVNELEHFFKTKESNLDVQLSENEYYSSTAFQLDNNKIRLFGVKFSFWGNLAAKIVNRILHLGAKEIIYFGKLGTLIDPKDIYTKLYSPTKYSVVYHDKLVCVIDSLENGLVKVFPELNSNMHTSVPTVLEEDYIQKELLEDLNSNSIDNEISQIAYTIEKFNDDYRKNIKFSCIHFPTDYLRQSDQPDLHATYDLSNNRTEKAISKKSKIILKACDYIYRYFKTKNI